MMPDTFATAAQLRAALEEIASDDIVTMMRKIGWNPERDFAGGDWRGLDFRGLDLRGFDFSNCRLYRAHFRNAHVAGAKFHGADISQSTLYLANGWKEADLEDDQRSIIEEHAAHIPPDAGEFVRKIQMASSFAEANATYQEMIDAGFSANKFALTALMDQTENASQTEHIYSRFSEAGISIDRVALNTLMSKMNSYTDRRAIFNGLSLRGITPDRYSYNILLDVFDNEFRADWLARMKKAGFAPDRITYNILIRRSEWFDEALDYLTEAEESGVSLTAADYNSLIRHADKDPKNVDIAIKRMLAAGFKPSRATANAVVTEARNTTEAWTVIDKMREFGIQPDIHTAFALLGTAEGIEEALEQVARLAALGLDVMVKDVVKLVLRAASEDTSRRAIDLCHESDKRLAPEIALRKLVQEFVPEERRSRALSTFVASVGLQNPGSERDE